MTIRFIVLFMLLAVSSIVLAANNKTDLELVYREAMVAYVEHDLTKAIVQFTLVLDLDPKHKHAMRYLKRTQKLKLGLEKLTNANSSTRLR